MAPSSKRQPPRVTIASLPPEIVSHIVDEVNLMREKESNDMQQLMDLGAHIGQHMGIDIPEMAPFLGAIGNMVLQQNQQNLNRAQPRPPPAPAAPPNPPRPQNLNAPLFNFNFFNQNQNQQPAAPAPAQARPPQAQPQPPLQQNRPFGFTFPLPSRAAAANPNPNQNQTQNQNQNPNGAGGRREREADSDDSDSDSDFGDMPPLIPTTQLSGPPTPPAPALPPSAAATNPRNELDDLPPLVADSSDSDSDDDPPPLALRTTAGSTPVPATSTSTPTLVTVEPAGGASSRQPSFPVRRMEEDTEGMPPLEPIDEDEDIAPRPPSNAIPAAPVHSMLNDSESDSDMPPLEPVDNYIPNATPAIALGSPQLGDDDESSDEMPPLQDVSDTETESEEEDIESGEEDDEDYDEDEDEDGIHSEDSDDDCIYPDGLPDSPLLPLQFVSRPFLHASRISLYRTINLTSAYQASLLLRSLASATHAARDEIEAQEAESFGTPKNVLGSMVRTLVIEKTEEGGTSDSSSGRGGGAMFAQIITFCPHLETLSLNVAFLKSNTKSIISALSSLRRLTRVELRSASDPQKPLLFTTARLFRLLQNSWPQLEELCITGLKGADEGPSREEDAMWDLDYELEDEQDENDDDAEAEKSEDDEPVKKLEKRERPRGLEAIKLFDPDVEFSELSLMLRDSSKTLRVVDLMNPSITLTRYGLTTTFLKSFLHITDLRLQIPASWHPLPKHSPKPPFPTKPKDRKAGEPSEALCRTIASYPYWLDAVALHLNGLKVCKWDGPLASTQIFQAFSSTVSEVAFGHSPAVLPAPLAKLLSKTVSRTRAVKNPDGSITNKSFKTIISKGLTCLRVEHDDLKWSDKDVRSLEQALHARAVCLHLSSGGTFDMPGIDADMFPVNFMPPGMVMGGVNIGLAPVGGRRGGP